MKGDGPTITFAASYGLARQVTEPQYNARHRVQAMSLEHNRTRNTPSTVPRSARSVCLVGGVAKSGTDATGQLPAQSHLSARSCCSAHLSRNARHPVTQVRTRPIATQFAGVVHKQAREHGGGTAPGHPVIQHDPTGCVRLTSPSELTFRKC